MIKKWKCVFVCNFLVDMILEDNLDNIGFVVYYNNWFIGRFYMFLLVYFFY